MAWTSPKESAASLASEWYPIVIPLVLLLGRIGMALTRKTYNGLAFPSDLCYYGATFYVWALTTKLSGQDVSLRPLGQGEWHLIIILLLINFFLYIVLYPVNSSVSGWKFLVSIVVAIVFGLGSPVYLRAR